MSNITSIVGQILFILSSIIVLFIVYKLVKPFRFHRKRKWSTMVFKLSFLVYLLVGLFFIYWYLFIGKNSSYSAFNENVAIHISQLFGDPKSVKLGTQGMGLAHVFLFLIDISIVLPVIAILVRRKIKKRLFFNSFFTAFNLMVVIYLLFYIGSK